MCVFHEGHGWPSAGSGFCWLPTGMQGSSGDGDEGREPECLGPKGPAGGGGAGDPGPERKGKEGERNVGLRRHSWGGKRLREACQPLSGTTGTFWKEKSLI